MFIKLLNKLLYPLLPKYSPAAPSHFHLGKDIGSTKDSEKCPVLTSSVLTQFPRSLGLSGSLNLSMLHLPNSKKWEWPSFPIPRPIQIVEN